MKQRFVCAAVLGLSLVSLHCVVYAGDSIPKAAWKRGIGEPLSHAGTKKANLEVIDDGYWQGAPVGGFGAGTFARTYAGNFSRWHLKTGVNKYETLYANQFAMYQRERGVEQLEVGLSGRRR